MKMQYPGQPKQKSAASVKQLAQALTGAVAVKQQSPGSNAAEEHSAIELRTPSSQQGPQVTKILS